jgi:protein-tyrosine phosphatase
LGTFSIVFVCTGNRFRSPLAESFVRQFTLGLPVTTRSFGTLELEDAPALPEAIEIALGCGIDLSSHRAQYLGNSSLAEVDLLLGFDQAHVQRAVVDAQAPRRRAFTFRGFVRLLAAPEIPPQENVVSRARHVVDEIDRVRAAEPESRKLDDMPDPFGRSWNFHCDTAAEIRELSILLVAALFGVTDTRRLPPVSTVRRNRGRRAPWRR